MTSDTLQTTEDLLAKLTKLILKESVGDGKHRPDFVFSSMHLALWESPATPADIKRKIVGRHLGDIGIEQYHTITLTNALIRKVATTEKLMYQAKCILDRDDLTSQQLHIFTRSSNPALIQKALLHKNADDELYKHTLDNTKNTPHSRYQYATIIARKTNASPETLTLCYERHKSYQPVTINLITNPNSSDELLKTMWKRDRLLDESSSEWSTWIRKPDVDEDIVEEIYNGSTGRLLPLLLEHKYAKKAWFVETLCEKKISGMFAEIIVPQLLSKNKPVDLSIEEIAKAVSMKMEQPKADEDHVLHCLKHCLLYDKESRRDEYFKYLGLADTPDAWLERLLGW